ncbi:ExbD/TolR family protein [Altererythrobacter sp. Root672]|uniref:ExbD/TolR family protein n=1 Tax=Altererythrobacter sp. Root672 TaxID=1736584 RepID=UPI0006F768C4|nr:biopolymer transporter ExbD [Altererythrobacter sp. Root672]KRA81455.1 biopolymer transporter ExbD [Altererythrobacter sp. Root672]
MSFATSSAGEPLREINTTPLIDVLLVLLVMIVLTIPVATHSLEYNLPSGEVTGAQPNPITNVLEITPEGTLVWNGRPTDEPGLVTLLGQVRAMKPEPEVQFRPDANASYRASARVLQIVKASGVTKFGFVGNEKYGTFSRGN